MEIIFVTGKGGVGKSTVAAAIALKRAEKGCKTLLAELGDQSFYNDFFGLGGVSYRPQTLRANLDLAQLSGEDSLREYALHLIKVESLYKIFFENTVTRALINVAPALPELAILGKITSGPPRNVGPKMPYDCIVVDAFASGHFEALLRAPQGMGQAVRFGPMGDQCRAIDQVLRDPHICQYYIVSFAEELPVVEACELSEKIQSQTGVKPIHILNHAIPLSKEELERPQKAEFHEFQNRQQVKLNAQNLFEQRLSRNQNKVILLPQIYKTAAWTIVESLAKELPDG